MCIFAANKHNNNGKMFEILFKFICKLEDILSTFTGWVCLATSFAVAKVCEFAMGKESLVYAVIICVIVDLFWALWRVFRDDGFALSDLVKDSVAKISIYGSAMLIGVCFDREGGNFLTSLITSVIILAEGISIIGSTIILFPNFKLSKLLERFFIGEIASKLGCPEDEVKKTLGTRHTKIRRKKA